MSEHPKNTALTRFSPQYPWRQQGLAQCLGFVKLQHGDYFLASLLNYSTFGNFCACFVHPSILNWYQITLLFFCIYFRLTLKINEHLSTACQCLKSPLRTFLVGKGSFSKTERTKLRAESHNVQKAKKIE